MTRALLALGLATLIAASSVALTDAARQRGIQEALRGMDAPPNPVWLDSLDVTKMVQRRQTPRAGQTLARGRGARGGAAPAGQPARGGAAAAAPLTLGGIVYPHGIG